LAERFIVCFEYESSRSIDDCCLAACIEGDEAGRHAGDDSFAEFFRLTRRVRSPARSIFEVPAAAFEAARRRFEKFLKQTALHRALCWSLWQWKPALRR
jgi:hypothetical protein